MSSVFVEIQTSSGVVQETIVNVLNHERAVTGKQVIAGFKTNEPIDKIQALILKADDELTALEKEIRSDRNVVLRLDSKTERYVVA